MISQITEANVGSAVRWLVTNASVLFAGQAWAAGADWQAIAGGAAAVAMLIWSFRSNKKKLA